MSTLTQSLHDKHITLAIQEGCTGTLFRSTALPNHLGAAILCCYSVHVLLNYIHTLSTLLTLQMQ